LRILTIMTEAQLLLKIEENAYKSYLAIFFNFIYCKTSFSEILVKNNYFNFLIHKQNINHINMVYNT
jgi:hypothetical protein